MLLTRRTERCFQITVLFVLTAAILSVGIRAILRTDNESNLRRACVSLSLGLNSDAYNLARKVLEIDPESTQGLLVAGEASARLRKTDESIQYFDRVSATNRGAWVQAQYGKAERQLWLGNASKAESLLRSVVQNNPQHIGANRSLSFLYQVLGRTFEAVPYARTLIQQGRFRGDQIRMVGATELYFVKDELFLSQCISAVPHDPIPLTATARKNLLRNETKSAEEQLREVINVYPTLWEAQGRLGRLLLNQGRIEELVAWHRSIPVDDAAHPEIWFVRGGLMQRLGNRECAARCYLECLLCYPNHVEATWQLSQALSRLGRQDTANEAGRRAAILAKIELSLTELSDNPDGTKMHEVVSDLVSLNRYWEACALCEMAIRTLPDAPEWAYDEIKSYASLVNHDHTFSCTPKLPLHTVTLDDFPRPPQDIADQATLLGDSYSTRIAKKQCTVRFTGDAQATGLHFSYFNGSVREKGLEHIFETTGGGVAVVDYDGDLWPDILFPQGCDLWVENSSKSHPDGLFRNHDGGEFANTSGLARLGSNTFSQGAAIGDFNNDGFSDIYIGNLGKNELLINNGDGTFHDITAGTGVAGDEWTLSPLIADLNDDSHPDIYVTNYLDPAAVIQRRCKRNGVPLTCAPTQFPAQDDRLYLNNGDGSFREVTQECGILCADGKGLALVAFRFPEDRCLSLFVGNDTTNNFLFRNYTTRSGAIPEFREEGVLTGLAADGAGRAQATMGIAADDANSDGRLDFFVTSFLNEANTLYLQQPGSTFLDSSRTSNLHDSSLNMLGFGTQFIDGELDGYPDIVVTNGHVDRAWATGDPDEMRPQYFQNLGSGVFDEVSAEQLGEFFIKKHLGRSLARLDWNRDGREDVTIGHLYEPAELLTNRTEETGNRVSLRLVGVQSNRDAIGAIAVLSANGRTWTKQLTAGDGYLSTNERRLVFGIGTITKINSIRVSWPNGLQTEALDVPVNHHITIIEDNPEFIAATFSQKK